MKAFSETSTSSLRALLAEIAFWPARILLLGLIFASPWYYGSVTWQAQAYIVPVAVAVFVLAIIGALLRNDNSSNPLVWSLAALLTLALFQTVQLPDWLWQTASTGAAFERATEPTFDEFKSALAAVGSAPESGGIEIPPLPRTLSIHWVQTRASSVMFALALACLISAGVLFRTRNWELTLLGVLALGGLTIAVVGLLQSVAWNKWTLLPMPTKSYFATFVSRNSAPQFLSMGLGAVLGLLAWWTDSKADGSDRKYYVRYPAINAVARFRRRLEELVADLDVFSLLCVFSATLFFVAVLAAGSRGGMLSCIAAAVLTLCVSLGTKGGYARTLGTVVLMFCGTLLLLTTLELDSAILGRLNTVNEEAYKLDNGRFTVWRMILSQPSCWVPGCGLGNFHFAILPSYLSQSMVWFYHAENIYIELLAEFGLLGLAIGLFGLGWLWLRVRWCAVSGRRAAPSFIAILLAVSAIGLQSLVDFSLIIPSICLPLATLVGCFLGRSRSSDFGKRTKSSELSKKNSSDSEYGQFAMRSAQLSQTSAEESTISPLQRSQSGPSLVLLGLVLFAVWEGATPLSGYAFAERLSSQLKALEKLGRTEVGTSAEEILMELDVGQVGRFADHPEVNLQIGRLYQAFAEETFAKQLKWTPSITAAQRASLAEPANIAAAFRATGDPRMTELRDLASQMPQQIETLRRSAERMAAAAGVCGFDWRCGWGLVRGDLNLVGSDSRARNYARLAHVTGQSSSIPAKIGAAALLAGEKQVGIRFLHDFLQRNPKAAVPIVSSLVSQMAAGTPPATAASELQLILPNSALMRAEVAEDLGRTSGRQEIANQLSANIQLEELFREAEVIVAQDPRNSKPWLLVASLAKRRNDVKMQAEALENALGAEPMNHAMRFELAKLLVLAGQRIKAIQQAERAARLSPETKEYKDFVEQNRVER